MPPFVAAGRTDVLFNWSREEQEPGPVSVVVVEIVSHHRCHGTCIGGASLLPLRLLQAEISLKPDLTSVMAEAWARPPCLLATQVTVKVLESTEIKLRTPARNTESSTSAGTVDGLLEVMKRQKAICNSEL